jgi:hypothetical protein
LLVALVGAAVLTALAAGRRTENAYPSFVRHYGFDAAGYAIARVPPINRLPEVRSAVAVDSPLSGQPRCACSSPVNASELSVFIDEGGARRYIKLLSGHLPSPTDPQQALISFNMAQTYGLHIGSHISVPFYAPSQLQAYTHASGTYPKALGPDVRFDVVGTEASEGEFPDGQNPSYDLVVGPAFGRVFEPRMAESVAYFVRLHGGPHGLTRFSNDVARLSGVGMLGYTSVDSANRAVQAAIAPQATGWWILAGLAALVGLLVVAQALSRESRVEDENFATFMTLGMTQRQLVGVGMLRTLVVAVSGAVGAVLIAFALSPLTPLGEARIAEPTTGFSFDTVVLLLGAGCLAAGVLLLGAWPAIRASRALPVRDRQSVVRASRMASQLTSAGAPPSVVVGVRRALEGGGGRRGVPARSALFGTTLAVAALCATAVFGAGLSDLVTHPSLYGVLYQLDFGQGAIKSPIEDQVVDDPSVLAVSKGFGSQVVVDHVPVSALALSPVKGHLLVTVIDGRPPSSPGQIALGPSTMRAVGAGVGSAVRVSVLTPGGTTRTLPFEVVAEAALPLVSGNTSLGNGVILSQEAYLDAVCPRGPRQSACRAAVISTTNSGMIVATVPGRAGSLAVDRYLRNDPSVASAPTTPVSLVNFGEAVNFPLLFALLLVVFGIATLIHVLALSVVRNRHEFGVLRVIGFRRRQVAFSVSWQATTAALIGVLIGLPLGIAVGRTVWLTFATNLGVVPRAVVPGIAVAALVGAVLVVANILAVVPGYLAARPRPHEQLRETSLG